MKLSYYMYTTCTVYVPSFIVTILSSPLRFFMQVMRGHLSNEAWNLLWAPSSGKAIARLPESGNFKSSLIKYGIAVNILLMKISNATTDKSI